MYLYGELQQVPAAILAAQLQCCHVADSSYQHCKATKKLQALDQCMCLHCSMTAAARGKVWGLDTITSQQSWKFQRVSLRFLSRSGTVRAAPSGYGVTAGRQENFMVICPPEDCSAVAADLAAGPSACIWKVPDMVPCSRAACDRRVVFPLLMGASLQRRGASLRACPGLSLLGRTTA